MCSSDIVNTVVNPFSPTVMAAYDDIFKGDQATVDLYRGKGSAKENFSTIAKRGAEGRAALGGGPFVAATLYGDQANEVQQPNVPEPVLATSTVDDTRKNVEKAKREAARRASSATATAGTRRSATPLGVDRRAALGSTSLLGL